MLSVRGGLYRARLSHDAFSKGIANAEPTARERTQSPTSTGRNRYKVEVSAPSNYTHQSRCGVRSAIPHHQYQRELCVDPSSIYGQDQEAGLLDHSPAEL